MLRSERIAKRINKEIKEWINSHDTMIVAIDGYAGSGKTTVADFLGKQNPDVLVIHLDDFIHHWKKRKQMIESAKNKAKVFEYEWYRYDDLEKLIKQFMGKKKGAVKAKTYDYDKNDFSVTKYDLSKKIMVIDGIFLFHPKHTMHKLWDKKIYLHTDLAKADKKRIAREKKKWGKAYVPENHPDNWVRHFKKAYRDYIKTWKPQRRADRVFEV